MDKINSLPDECLVSIISFLPTKVAVSTSVLSKRWECLWMWMLKLEYYDGINYTYYESEKLRCFLHRTLPLHKSPVMEKLSLKFFNTHFKPEDINLWVVVAASRCIHELEISYSSYPANPFILPSSLFNNKSLVILKLFGGSIILEVVPRNVCLPSLKTLELHSLTYAFDESLQRLLSICPVLEDLSVNLWGSEKMKMFAVIVPSLQRLTLYTHHRSFDVDGFVINTPSLVYFKLYDQIPKRHYYVIENMPKLVEAFVIAEYPDVKILIGSFTSVKRLTLCSRNLDSEAIYGASLVFNKLEHLKICVCNNDSLNLIFRLLKDSPNLRILELFRMEFYTSYITHWNEPTLVPGCLLSSLQIFNWKSYDGSPEERDLVVYILKNAYGLKTATISFSDRSRVPKLEMIKELKLSSRASSTCQLVFD